jgi:hypothetical protein
MYCWEPMDSRGLILRQPPGLKPNELSNFIVAAKAVTYRAEATNTAGLSLARCFEVIPQLRMPTPGFLTGLASV